MYLCGGNVATRQPDADELRADAACEVGELRLRTKVVVGLSAMVLAALLLAAASLVLWFLSDGPMEGWQEDPASRHSSTSP